MFDVVRPYFNGTFFYDPWLQMIWHRDHGEVPVFVIALYLVFVFRGQKWMADRKAYTLKLPLTLWNFSLALFSWVGAFATVPRLINGLLDKGYRYTLCASPYDWSAEYPAGLFVGLFIYSKIPELLDTVFLILRKRNVIFLHWYHHVTVLLFCWQAWHTCVGYGIYFASVNYSVHALMYTYYFCTNIGVRGIVRPLAPFITGFQLSQMAFGLAILGSVWYYATISTRGPEKLAEAVMAGKGLYDPEACHYDNANLKLGLAMYSSYFLLFAEYFWNKYVLKIDDEGERPRPEHEGEKKGENGKAETRETDKTK
jgi:hypothetical protein